MNSINQIWPFLTSEGLLTLIVVFSDSILSLVLVTFLWASDNSCITSVTDGVPVKSKSLSYVSWPLTTSLCFLISSSQALRSASFLAASCFTFASKSLAVIFKASVLVLISSISLPSKAFFNSAISSSALLTLSPRSFKAFSVAVILEFASLRASARAFSSALVLASRSKASWILWYCSSVRPLLELVSASVTVGVACLVEDLGWVVCFSVVLDVVFLVVLGSCFTSSFISSTACCFGSSTFSLLVVVSASFFTCSSTSFRLSF